jgi:hypothetical protein
MRYLVAIVSAALLASAGCSRAPTLAAQVRSAGGAASLKRECQSLLEEHKSTNSGSWMVEDSALPPTIAALRPQAVEVRGDADVPFVYIQMPNRFGHCDLMVVLTNTPEGFMPRHKKGWTVTKISDGVFECRE